MADEDDNCQLVRNPGQVHKFVCCLCFLDILKFYRRISIEIESEMHVKVIWMGMAF